MSILLNSEVSQIHISASRPLNASEERSKLPLQGIKTLDFIEGSTIKVGLGFSHLMKPEAISSFDLKRINRSESIEKIRNATQKRVERYLTGEDQNATKARLERVEARLKSISDVEERLAKSDEEEVLGAVGWGKHCLFKTARKSNVAQYDSIISRNRNTGRLTLHYLANPLLEGRNRESDGGGRRKYLSLESEHITDHAGNHHSWEAVQLEIKRLNESSAGTGGNANTIGCCSKVSLDEIAGGFTGKEGAENHGASELHEGSHLDSIQMNMKPSEDAHAGAAHHTMDGWVEIPSSAFDASFAGAISYISLAGVIIGLGVIRGHYEQLVTEICEVLGRTVREIQRIEIEYAHLEKAERDEIELSLRAKVIFSSRQLQEALFQLYSAGYLSGFSSLIMLVGQLIPPLQPIALGGNGLVGLTHLFNASKNLGVTLQDRNRHANKILADLGAMTDDSQSQIMMDKAEPAKPPKAHREALKASPMRQFFDRKLSNLLANITSWSFFSAGAVAITVSMLAMIGVSLVFPPMPLLIAGIVLLIPGIIGTTVYNNRQASNQFTPGMPLKIANSVTSENMAERFLMDADKLLRETENINNRKRLRNPVLDRLRHTSLALSKYRLFNWLTIGVFSSSFMEAKAEVKGVRASDAVIEESDMIEHLRKFLPDQKISDELESEIVSDKLSSSERYQKILSSGEEFFPDNQLTKHFGKLLGQACVESKTVRTRRIISPLQMWKSEKVIENRVENERKIEGSGDSIKVDAVKDGREIRTYRRLKLIEVVEETTFTIKDKYAPILTKFSDGSELIQNLRQLKVAKPCCEYLWESQNVIGELDLQTEENRQLFDELLKRYVLFQAEKDAKREIALWSEYLAAFNLAQEQAYEAQRNNDFLNLN